MLISCISWFNFFDQKKVFSTALGIYIFDSSHCLHWYSQNCLLFRPCSFSAYNKLPISSCKAPRDFASPFPSDGNPCRAAHALRDHLQQGLFLRYFPLQEKSFAID